MYNHANHDPAPGEPYPLCGPENHMYKFVAENVVVFDVEWVPDPVSGRRVYGIPDSASDNDVLEIMWREGGATSEDPRPYLKTVLCRVVSIAAVVRKKIKQEISLELVSLPGRNDGALSEKEIIQPFLEAVGNIKAQLVGFNSSNADLPILIQRGLASQVHAPLFCHRPEKPWEGVDYFARYSDYNIDLKDIVGGFGKSTPSLHELASSLGIPGKLGTSGGDVIDLWLGGNIKSIVEYNEYDALTTYLVWLRTAYFSGQLSEAEFASERGKLKQLLQFEIENGASHLSVYLDAWRSCCEH